MKNYIGGPYWKVRKAPGEAHHIPADSISPISKSRGPAIQMEPDDHHNTSSYGSSENARKYRAEIEQLINYNRMREAMAKEIKDVRRKMGLKYNSAIREMLNYAKEKGFI